MTLDPTGEFEYQEEDFKKVDGRGKHGKNKGGRPKGTKNKPKPTLENPQEGVILIPYKARKWALPLHKTKKRWNVLVIHRRAGKTVAALNHLQRDALHIPMSRFAFIAPTYKQAKNVAWDLLKFYARNIPGVEFNEVELIVRYPNGAKVQLFGADNPDSLRGIGLHGVVFDEYSQQPGNIFTEIIAPALADNEGYAIWIGTPKGHNEFYRLYMKALANPKDWLAMKLDWTQTKALKAKEIEYQRSVMSADEFEQEFECSFEASIRGAYYAKEIQKARAEKRIRTVPYDELLPVYTVWDLGVGDATGIGFYQKVHTEIRMIDYYENSDVGLTHYIKMLKEKGYVYGAHFAPHDIKVREFTSGKSRWEIARDLGVEFVVLDKLGIEDGITAGRIAWNRLYVDEAKCGRFLDAIAQYQKEFDDKTQMYKERPKHDWTSHAADVHRYMAQAESEFSNQVSYQELERVESTRLRKHSGQ